MKNARFTVLFCMSVVLFAANGIISIKSDSAADAGREQNKSTVSTRLFVPSSSLYFIAEGGERFSPTSYRLSPKGFLQPEYQREVNRKLPDFPALDWIFIVKIVFGL